MLKTTATDLPRLLTCNGSRLMDKVSSVNQDNTVRDEGNAADWLIEQVFAGQHLPEELIDRKAENGVYITADMVDHLSAYFEWIKGRGVIEVDCSHSDPSWVISGRADHVWFDEAAQTLYISDFKYGWKIVDVLENWTLMSHAIGFIKLHQIKPNRIVFKIFQPRPYHPEGYVRSYTLSFEELQERSAYLSHKLMFIGDNLQTSKHCYKCPALAICPAAQMAAMNAIDVSCNTFNSDVSNSDLEFLLEQTERAMTILKETRDAYENLAMNKLKNGQVFTKYILQNDLGRERWKSDVEPEFIEAITGKKLTKTQLITPNQAKKTGISEDVLKMFTEIPNTGVKLVKVDPQKRAEKLFNRK